MSEGAGKEVIRRIIDMEDRINQCKRCVLLRPCVRKPSLGKGELEPDIVMVFEYESDFIDELKNIVGLHDMLRDEFGVEKTYHSYLVRCQPKACDKRNSISCYNENKLIDVDGNCLLTGAKCDGIPVRPGNQEIIACLSYLGEEIEILNPRFVVLFGDKVGD